MWEEPEMHYLLSFFPLLMFASFFFDEWLYPPSPHHISLPQPLPSTINCNRASHQTISPDYDKPMRFWLICIEGYRQPAYIALHKTLHQIYNLQEDNEFMILRVPLRYLLTFFFRSEVGRTSSRIEVHGRNFEYAYKTLNFQGPLDNFRGTCMASSCMALPCFCRFSSQKFCNMHSCQTISEWALLIHFSGRYKGLKWGSTFCIFHKTSSTFSNFLRANHGHSGHGHSVRRGFRG